MNSTATDPYGGPGMRPITVTGSSYWSGSFYAGSGTISTDSGTLNNLPYTYASRFEGAPGACPEELLAAAHAACFNHALANIARVQNLVVESMHTTAHVSMGRDELGPAILGIHLSVEAFAPTLTNEQFADVANRAKVGCAFSKALAIEITMDAVRTAAATLPAATLTEGRQRP